MSASLFHILNISRQDMLTRLMDLDTVSHNLANINTAGFKRNRANFQELLAARDKEGIHMVSSQVLTGQGALRKSENPLDLAISGEGFFALSLPDGATGYTRDGRFSLDGDGQLVNANGFPLVWEGSIPPGAEEVRVEPNGRISVRQGSDWTAAGTLQLVRFPNAGGLTSRGDNVWLESEISGEAIAGAPGQDNLGQIVPQALEQSNVSLADEMTRLMTLQRVFQMSIRAFQQTDEMITGAIHLRKA